MKQVIHTQLIVTGTGGTQYSHTINTMMFDVTDTSQWSNYDTLVGIRKLMVVICWITVY